MLSHLPDMVFHLRHNNSEGVEDWLDMTTKELFGGKRIVLFAVPGAFTPTCSKAHLPGYEAHYKDLKSKGVDEVYCLSVNDAFIMNAWADSLGIKNVKMLADGNGEFSEAMGMLVKRTSQGLGLRSWRYSLYADDLEIKKAFVEPNMMDNPKGVPLDQSSAENMLDYLS